MITIPNRPDAAGRPPEPPRRADGEPYAYEMIHDGGNSRSYADDADDLVALLIPGYRDAPDTQARLRLRLRFAVDVAVRLQALILADPQYETALAALPAAQRAMLGASRATPPAPLAWTAPVPLVLVTTDYAPVTQTPRPRGLPDARGRQDRNIIWIDPIEPEALLFSLADAGVITLGALRPRRAREQAAALAPYDAATGSGIVWQTGTVQLWDRGDLVATVDQDAPSARAYWEALRFVEDFPQITHWHTGSVWTGRYRLTAPTPDALESADVLEGTIQFVEEEGDRLAWRVDTAADPWEVTVPLPPFEEQTNILLQLILARRVVDLVGGEIAPNEWRVASGVVPSEALAQALPTDWAGWRLAGAGGSPRATFCRALGL